MLLSIRTAALGMALAGGLIFSAPSWSAATSGYRVLHHESVRVLTEKGTGAHERMTFSAYGRQFALSVAPNERIRRGVTTNGQTVPLAGSVEGIPGSWVRVTRSSSGLRGMMFDGQEMYAIEPAAEAAAVTVQPLSTTDGDTVVYRLADTVMPVETMTCEIADPDSTPDSPATAADALEALSTELHSFRIAAASTAMKQVRIGVVGDYEFVSQFTSTTPEDAIIARMNIVDGIFSTQLGVKISLATPTLFRTSSDPFTKTKASELLTELRTFRSGSQAQRQLGLTHLMTGRNLDGTTVGIAYIKGLCDSQYGTSLSQSGSNTTQAALIAAHEIGHNFGAPHDGETGACQSTPTTFLMAPQLNGSDQFSACSVQQIQPQINNASCLTAYTPPDASIEVTNGTLSATVGTSLIASFMVHATGDDASPNVTATVTLPTSVTIQSVSANGGTCTSGAGTASCTIGTLAAGDSRQVDLNVTPTEAGTFTLNLAIDSSNDPNADNDTGTITINASTTGGTPTDPGDGTGSASGNGGGGGGGFDYVALSFLGLMALGVTRRRSAGLSHRRAA